jgi:hypothetical protein
MICVIAMIVFGVMALFSSTHRPLAKEAFDCVFRKVTFRKCNSDLDQRIKGDIVGRTMKKSPGFARFIHKWFSVISWLLLIITIVSLVYSVIGIYNLAVYDNCNGEEGGYCVITDSGDVTLDYCDDPECPGCSSGGECTSDTCTCGHGADCAAG